MQGVGGCLWGQRHFGSYTQAISRGDRITRRAFADHESRDVYGKTMAIARPPLVRGLLVGTILRAPLGCIAR
ncbi:MAG: hypothetical protein HQ464_10590 [Planctomycetes bacterium]|nr:hypothetical protein [Planctomycetota bacterium]